MNKIIIVVVVIVILAAGGFFLMSSKNNVIAPTAPVSSPTTNPLGPSDALQPEEGAMMEDQTVTLSESGFTPATLTVKAGTTVKWVNNSGKSATVSSNPHPTHTNYTPLNLGQFNGDTPHSLTFDALGTYGYHNHLNPAQKGTIIVQ